MRREKNFSEQTQYHVRNDAVNAEQHHIRQKQESNRFHDQKICDGLDITLVEFFDTDVFKNLDQEIK